MSNLLSVTEAAALLGKDVSTVRRWCASGHLRAVRLGAKAWMIDPSDLAQTEAPRRGAPRRKGKETECT